MRVKGRAHNGTVVLPDGVELPEGAEVEVVCEDERSKGRDLVRRIEAFRKRLKPLGVSVIELIREGRRRQGCSSSTAP